MEAECVVYHIRRPGMSLQEGYIGVTCQTLARRFCAHKAYGNAHLKNAIALYGDISIAVVDSGTVGYCLKIETELRPGNNIGWNIVAGGGKPPISKKGRKHSEAALQLLRQRNKTLSSQPEQRARLSKLHSGKTISEEHKLIISNAQKGKTRSAETRQRMSIGMTGVARSQVACMYCGLTSIGSNIARWHNEKCKHKGVLSCS